MDTSEALTKEKVITALFTLPEEQRRVLGKKLNDFVRGTAKSMSYQFGEEKQQRPQKFELRSTPVREGEESDLGRAVRKMQRFEKKADKVLGLKGQGWKSVNPTGNLLKQKIVIEKGNGAVNVKIGDGVKISGQWQGSPKEFEELVKKIFK
ncbi:Uncharacterised protein [Candidatus Gugararchaeum adminiculabundum]|nr:Uncharacterised protein [Candidatus Gugararchaeum adminiculabundum]